MIDHGQEGPISLYLHFPFCERKCRYCDFLSGPASEEAREEYVRLLCREILLRKEEIGSSSVDTVFLGGGTPSLMTPDQLRRVMEALRDTYSVEPDAEISMEVNPGTADPDKLRAYREAGINRLSIGVQSFDDGELRMLGRIHTADQAREIFRAARRAGFTNINLDLMSALPGQNMESWARTLREAVSLRPEHISAYSLIIEEGTPLAAMVEAGKMPDSVAFADAGEEATGFADAGEEATGFADTGEEAAGFADAREEATGFADAREEANAFVDARQLPALPSEEEDRAIYHFTGKFLAENGYRRYEISNYAAKGAACRHNCGYWTGHEYLGLGLGASSDLGGERFRNPFDMEEYRRAVEEAGAAARGCSGYAGLMGDASACAAAGRVESQDSDCAGTTSDLVFRRERQRMTAEDRMEEFMFLGLRLIDGVSEKEFLKRFGKSIEEVFGNVVERQLRQGVIRRFAAGESGLSSGMVGAADPETCYSEEDGSQKDHRIALTTYGLDVANYVMAEYLL